MPALELDGAGVRRDNCTIQPDVLRSDFHLGQHLLHERHFDVGAHFDQTQIADLRKGAVTPTAGRPSKSGGEELSMRYLMSAAAMLALVGFVGVAHAADAKPAKPKPAHFVKLEGKELTVIGGAKGKGKQRVVAIDDSFKWVR